MREDLEDSLNNTSLRMARGFEATEFRSYAIWGAAVTATRAFDNVTIKIDPDTQRIFVAITLRWWAKFERFEPLRKAWLMRAEKRCKEQVPEGFKLLVYYDKENKKDGA